jgi:hypothetical protein
MLYSYPLGSGRNAAPNTLVTTLVLCFFWNPFLFFVYRRLLGILVGYTYNIIFSDIVHPVFFLES